jgi:hypothetical protein
MDSDEVKGGLFRPPEFPIEPRNPIPVPGKFLASVSRRPISITSAITRLPSERIRSVSARSAKV